MIAVCLLAQGQASPLSQSKKAILGAPLDSFQAGVARIDITPGSPVAMEGYQDPETRISTGIHDRLYARVFAFRRGSKRLVLISCDLGSFMFAGFFQNAIQAKFDLKPDELFLCATHTHSGPALSLNRKYPHPNNFSYSEDLKGELVKVVGMALEGMIPVRMSVGRAISSVGVNRRLIMPDGTVRMLPNPDGPSDPEVLVAQFAGADGRTMGSLFDYACHSRSLNRNNTMISGDIFGIAEQSVEQASGAAPICAAFAGASGDIDPMRVVSGFDAGPGQESETERMGAVLAAEVRNGLRNARIVSAAGEIKTLARKVVLPRKAAGTTGPINVIAARIGDVAFVGLDCEALVEVGKAIKAASPFPFTFLITNCNGWAGYLPPAHRYGEGGYEVNRSGFAAGAAEILARQTVEMLTDLRK